MASRQRDTSPRTKDQMPPQPRSDARSHRSDPPDVLVRDHERWQVSWLADPCLAPPSQLPSGVNGARLTAYSCGGSRGIGSYLG